ncbi:hypothetical protein Tco_0782855 [Tanacetum coccineum]
MAEGEIDNLTMEQYLALTRGNQAPGVVKPEIGGNVNFEIKSQFMRELREDTFFRNKNDDAHEHVERFLDIVSLFNILEVSHDDVMLRVFLITLTGAAKRWVDRIPLGIIDSWNLLKKPLSKGTIHHQKQPSSLKKSATSSRKETRLYTKLGNVDSQGPIPGMTPAQALTAIQTMADHSQKWHDGTSNRNIEGSSNSEGIAAIVSKLDNLGPPGYYTRIDNRPPFGEKRPSLEEIMNKHLEESTRRRAKMEEWSSGPIHLVADETVIKEWEDRMERAATTASSLEVEHDSGNINRTQSMTTLNESFPQGTDSGSGPRCQDTILGGSEAQTRFEAAFKQSNDPPLSRVNTLGSGSTT